LVTSFQKNCRLVFGKVLKRLSYIKGKVLILEKVIILVLADFAQVGHHNTF